MAYMIKLQSFSDQRGRLTPVDKVLPFDMVRLYYICNMSEQANRGGHYHKITKEAIFCVNGSFTVVVNNGKTREEFFLNDHTQCVVIEPYEWHMIHNFSTRYLPPRPPCFCQLLRGQTDRQPDRMVL